MSLLLAILALVTNAPQTILSWDAKDIGAPATVYSVIQLGTTSDTNWVIAGSVTSTNSFWVVGPERTNALGTNWVTRYKTNVVTKTVTNTVTVRKTNYVTITNIVWKPR